jgi:hypothetical protein
MSLQFCQSADYFLVMPETRSSRQTAGFRHVYRALTATSAIVFGAACDERERLTFSPGDDLGPVTTIDQPGGVDTTITAGPQLFFVNGTTLDPDGVQTVHFLVIGGNQGFPPVIPNPTRASVRFGIALTTVGHSGETWEVQIYGVDVFGNQGNTSTRLIHIQ